MNTLRCSASALIGAVVSACGPGPDAPSPPANRHGCRLEVSADVINFGRVAEPRAIRRLTLAHAGVGGLCRVAARIERAATEPQTPGFEWGDREPGARDFTLGPGETRPLAIAFRGEHGASGATVVIESSDPDRPIHHVLLAATRAAAEQLVIDPPAVSWDPTPVGCASPSTTIALEAQGRRPVVLRALELDALVGTFSLSRAPAVPHRLSPGDPVELDVGFFAVESVPYAGTLAFEAVVDGAPTRFEVPLAGRGFVPEARVREPLDVWRRGNSVDLLLVIDGGAAPTTLASIGRGLVGLVELLDADTIDYRIGVTTADVTKRGGELLPLDAPLESQVLSPNGAHPAHLAVWEVTEALEPREGPNTIFDAARAAIDRSRAELGPDWLRDGVPLHVVAFTDRSDESTIDLSGLQHALRPLDDVGDGTLRVSAVAGGPTGCASERASALAAPELADAANASGGVDARVCELSWREALATAIADAMPARLPNQQLSERPIPSTVRVLVEGEVLPPRDDAGPIWSLNARDPRIVFHPHPRTAVTAGVEVVAEYAPEACP